METKKHCPICGGVDLVPRKTFSAESAADWFCPAIRDHARHARLSAAIEELWNAPTCRMVECSTCEFLFADPYISGSQEFYAILHEQSGYPTQRWEYAIAADELTAHELHPSALDIGSGNGAFFNSLPNSVRCFATESTDKLRLGLRKKGIEAHATLEDFPSELDGTFGLVTLFHVIEHVANPQSLFKQIHRLLSPTGRLVISTPHLGNQTAVERCTGQSDAPPNHISIYSYKSMHTVLENAFFKVEKQLMEPSGLNNVLKATVLRNRSTARQSRWTPPALAARLRNQKARHAATALSLAWDIPSILSSFKTVRLSNNFLTVAKRLD